MSCSSSQVWGLLPEDLEMWYHGHFFFVLFSIKLTVNEKKLINMIKKLSSIYCQSEYASYIANLSYI